VPVILILIFLVPVEDARTEVIQNQLATTESQVSITSSAGAARESELASNTVVSELENGQVIKAAENLSATQLPAMQRSFLAGNWVVVDCEQRVVVQCPHRLLSTGTSPRFGEKTNMRFQSHCRDVSIKLDSFCRL